MGYSQENGYVPTSIQEIIESFRVKLNEQFGTTYTTESFAGTNFYKYFYAQAQLYQLNEIKTSEIFLKLQKYIEITNEMISRPVNTPNGLIDKLGEAGYIASVKPMIDADAGKANICVDVFDTDDDYEDQKLEICTIIKDSCVAGIPTYGTESENIVLTNGQAFDFKYHLPDRTNVWLRLTVTLSENNQVVIAAPDETIQKLVANIQARYALGKNFEPQRYFNVTDAPWSSQILLEWSEDYNPESPGGETWHDEVFNADFDELLMISLDRVILVEV